MTMDKWTEDGVRRLLLSVAPVLDGMVSIGTWFDANKVAAEEMGMEAWIELVEEVNFTENHNDGELA